MDALVIGIFWWKSERGGVCVIRGPQKTTPSRRSAYSMRKTFSVREIEFSRRLVSRFEVFVPKGGTRFMLTPLRRDTAGQNSLRSLRSSALRLSGRVASRDGVTTVEASPVAADTACIACSGRSRACVLPVAESRSA